MEETERADAWDEAVLYNTQTIRSPSTTIRSHFYRFTLLPLVSKRALTDDQAIVVSSLLLDSAIHYPLTARSEVLNVLDAVCKKYAGATASAILSHYSEVVKSLKRAPDARINAAPSTLSILYSWGLHLAAILLSDGATEIPKQLLLDLSVLLDSIAAYYKTHPHLIKYSRKDTVNVLGAHTKAIPKMMEVLLNSHLSPDPSISATFLDILAHTALQSGELDLPKEKMRVFYVTYVLNPKNIIPLSTVHGISLSLGWLISNSDLDEMAQLLAKSLLRAPEKTLSALNQLLSICADRITPKFAQTLLPSVLNGLKSSQAGVREQSSQLFRNLAGSADDEEKLDVIARDLEKNASMAKTSSPEFKLQYYGLFRMLPSNATSSQRLLPVMTQLASKEQNEPAAIVCVMALFVHLQILENLGVEAPASIAADATNAFKAAKPAVRRTWALELANYMWPSRAKLSSAQNRLLTSFLPILRESSLKLASSPPNFNNSYLEGHIYIALAQGVDLPTESKGAEQTALKKLLDSEVKSSFLYSEKIFARIDDLEESRWAARCAVSVLPSFPSPSEKGLALAHGLLLLVVSSQSWKSRDAALQSISDENKVSPLIVGPAMLAALGKWTLEANLDANLHISRLQARQICRLLSTLTSWSSSVEVAFKSQFLVDCLIPAHQAEQVQASFWVSLLLSAGITPEVLVESHLDEIVQILRVAMAQEATRSAALAAISSAALVLPNSLYPKVFDVIEEDLQDVRNATITDENIRIWKTPAGTLAIDVLSNQKSKGDAKKGANKTEKWEEELRQSLKAKSGPVKKLTKDELALVDGQLQQETQIRQRMQIISDKISESLNFVERLALGNPDAARQRITSLMNFVLAYLKQPIESFVGQQGITTYMTLSALCEDLVFGQWLGYAVLRVNEITGIPENWTQEPLRDLVLRLLYRLQSSSERQPMDSATFSYAFPLMESTLELNGVDVKSPEESLEQTTHVVGTLAAYTHVGDNPHFPLEGMVKALLMVVEKVPKLRKDARSSLVDLCSGMDIPTNAVVQQLLSVLISDDSHVRATSLQALSELDLLDFKFLPEVWIAKFDEDEANAKLASDLWDENDMSLPPNFEEQLSPLLCHQSSYVRLATAKSIAEAAQEHPSTLETLLSSTIATYQELAKPIVPEYDAFGMIKPESLTKADPWEARLGQALALQYLSPDFDQHLLDSAFKFLLDGALGDQDARVRKGMLDAGLAAIEAHGEEHVEMLTVILESYLDQPAVADEFHDYMRQAVVILFGALARHLSADDERVPSVIKTLVETLKTPSEVVQFAVAECLPLLVKNVKDEAPALIGQLLEDLLHAEKYAVRRGSAYGLAGVVKGRGTTALKEYNIMTTLKKATENKGDYKSRQGAMFAFETLSLFLGRLFEPYVIQILPHLLTGFGDSVADVREATQDAAKVIMGKISGHCVKLILPTLLNGLDDRQWRTKKGSIELLGSMAFCAPKQLSTSLPTIVPRLADVLTDTHANVRSAANESLRQFGEVINNPEIQALVPILLQALSYPNQHTIKALDALLSTSFVHYIDAPSLALVVPIVERGLRERGSEVKRKSAQIVGSMASLTDAKDLATYLDRLVPLVKEVLVDPVPDARSTAAKALGTLVETLGEDKFPGIVASLLMILKNEGSGVDRQGAAQGLSEILAGLGVERLEELLPEIVKNANHSKSYIREGFLSLLIYLPSTYGARFQPYLGRIIQPILNGLADESEYIRDVSMRAGKMIIAKYANKAIDLLLPELEKGLFDPDWHIRQSSVQLVGDLLFRISGIQGSIKEDVEEEEPVVEVGTEASRKALLDVLGQDRRDRILAALYMLRQDSSGVVRHGSVYVWKALVQNTPKTIKEILPAVITIIIKTLASSDPEQQQVAARTLGRELVRKLGENILPQILPILQKGLTSDDEGTRQGVCFALREIMETLGSESTVDVEDSLIPAIRTALMDPVPQVREAAAQAFDALLHHVGNKAINEVVPSLLHALEGENSDHALEALKEMMAIRSNVLFPVLIPQLISVPISPFNAHALASLSAVAGAAINRRLSSIVLAFVDTSIQTTDATIASELELSVKTILLSVETDEGLNVLMSNLQSLAKDKNHKKRMRACKYIAVMYAESKLDMSAYTADLIGLLVSLFDDRQADVVKSGLEALNAVCKSVAKEDMDRYVIPLRKAIRNVGVADVDVPGLCLPKAIGAPLAIFLQGLMFGNNDQREQSAMGIAEMVQRTSVDAMKPYVTQMTGPLIRVIGDRYPASVKAAILYALEALLKKSSVALKPFLPQLQRTFIKALTDPSSTIIRTRAAAALGILISMQPRIDPLITELVTNTKAAELSVKDALFTALERVIANSTTQLSPVTKKAISELVSEHLQDSYGETIVAACARVLGKYAKRVSAEELEPLVTARLLVSPPTMSSILGINGVLAEAALTIKQMDGVGEMTDLVIAGIETNRYPVTEFSILAAGKILLTKAVVTMPTFDGKALLSAMVKLLDEADPGSSEARRLALVTVRAVARQNPSYLSGYLSVLVPRVLSSVRVSNTPVKLAAERAMVYMFQMVDNGDKLVNEYCSKADINIAKAVQEYQRRTLSRLAEQERERVKSQGQGVDREAEDEDSEVWLVGSAEGMFNVDDE